MENTLRAQLGGAAVVNITVVILTNAAETLGQRELVMLTILFALLVRALVACVLAAEAGSGEQRSFLLQPCELHAAASCCARLRQLGVPAAAVSPQLLGVPVAAAAALRAGVGGGQALRRFKGRGAAWVRWT